MLLNIHQATAIVNAQAALNNVAGRMQRIEFEVPNTHTVIRVFEDQAGFVHVKHIDTTYYRVLKFETFESQAQFAAAYHVQP